MPVDFVRTNVCLAGGSCAVLPLDDVVPRVASDRAPLRRELRVGSTSKAGIALLERWALLPDPFVDLGVSAADCLACVDFAPEEVHRL